MQKKQNIGTCKLCLEENVKLTKAHLFSKCLLEFLGHPIKCTIQNEKKPLTFNEGWFDYILCVTCNNETTSKHESILKGYLSLHRTPYDLQLQASITKFLQENQLTQDQLYSHLKLAILSFFWQFQVADVKPAKEKIKFFQIQIAATDLENIRKMIKEGSPGLTDEYPVGIAYNVPKKRLETITQEELSYTSNEIRFDIFTIKLFFPCSNGFYFGENLNILSPNNIDQPLDDKVFSYGEMRNAILDESHAQFIQNLFERGKNDDQPLQLTPSHPLRILKELIAISLLRSKEHYETIINVMLNNLNSQNEFLGKYTPLDVLEEFMSHNSWGIVDQHDSHTRLQNLPKTDDDSSLKTSEYWQLRNHIIKNVIDELDLNTPGKNYASIKFLMFNCISYVESNLEVQQRVNEEGLATLTVLKTLIHEKKLSIPSLAIVAITINNIEYYSPISTEVISMLIELRELIHLQINNLDKKLMFWLTKRHNLAHIKHSLKDSAAETLECTHLAAEVISKYPNVDGRNEYVNSTARIIKESIPEHQNESLDTLTHFCIELEKQGALIASQLS